MYDLVSVPSITDAIRYGDKCFFIQIIAKGRFRFHSREISLVLVAESRPKVKFFGKVLAKIDLVGTYFNWLTYC